MRNTKISLASASIAAALMLTACGGGGGSAPTSASPSTSTPVVTTPTVPTVDNALVTSVAAPTYGAASGELQVFNALNDLRSKVGSGLFAQNAKLDKSAASHWNYLEVNSIASLHSETAGVTGFTGVDATARATAAGYASAYTDEVIYGENGADKAANCIASWANSIYHINVLFSGMRDVGIAAMNTKADPTFGVYTVCVLDFSMASSQSEQLPDDGAVRAYPYAGQTNVPVVFYNQAERPTPLPAFPELGAPVVVNFKTKSFASTAKPTVAISQFTLTPAGGVALDAKILVNQAALSGASISTNGPELTADAQIATYNVALAPTTRLKANTVYTVNLIAVVNGKAVTKSWSFTTAAN